MAQDSIYLFVTDTGLTTWSGEPSQLSQTHAFPADAEGHAGLGRYVDEHPRALYYLVLDLQEEDYRAETIPHVGGRDRRRLLNRRLEQLYRESRYRSATPQGRETAGRRDDRVLLAALTNPKILDQWTDVLLAKDARIVGIYSVTLLIARHIRKLTAIPPNALIVSRQFGSGLRQTYIANGSLRFSRLTQPDEGEQSLAALLAAEAARARQFLASLRAIERQEAMQVVMICNEAEAAQLPAQCPNSELIHYHFLGFAEVAKALKVSAEDIGETAEPLWLRHVAAYRPSNQYATPAQRKPYVAWQTSRALVGLAVLTTLASVGTAAWFWQQGRALDIDTVAQKQRQLEAERIYAANVPQRKEGELTPTGMKDVVEAYRQQVGQWPQLEPSLQRVSKVIENYPDVELDELAWQVTTDPNILPNGFTEGSAPGEAPPPSTSAPADANAGGATQAAAHYIVIGLRGQLPDYELRARDSLALVDNLAKDFAATPGTTVTKLQLPVDTRPDKSITLGEGQQSDQGVPFALKISFPLDAPANGATPGAAP